MRCLSSPLANGIVILLETMIQGMICTCRVEWSARQVFFRGKFEMNKKSIIGIAAIGAALLIAAGLFLMTEHRDEINTPVGSEGAANSTTQPTDTLPAQTDETQVPEPTQTVPTMPVFSFEDPQETTQPGESESAEPTEETQPEETQASEATEGSEETQPDDGRDENELPRLPL